MFALRLPAHCPTRSGIDFAEDNTCLFIIQLRPFFWPFSPPNYRLVPFLVSVIRARSRCTKKEPSLNYSYPPQYPRRFLSPGNNLSSN